MVAVRLAACVVVLAGVLVGGLAQAAPNVLVTVKPVHALVAGVMDGVATPYLLLRGGSSPHSYAMRPSDARALQSADVVVWVGEGLEAFFERPLEALAGTATVVELMEAPGVTLLPSRRGGVWEEDAHDDEREEHEREKHGQDAGHDAGHDHGMVNAHIWLSPANARAIVAAVADTLATLDAGNAARYRQNAAALDARIEAQRDEIAGMLAPVRERPYVVFHDAYHYFEDSFGTRAVGSITVSPDRAPGLRRVAEIRRKVEASGAVCVFAEPQFQPDIVETLVQGTSARRGTLDPIGSTLEAGPAAWFEMMRNIARALADCLAPG